jgi:hypothetical protein
MFYLTNFSTPGAYREMQHNCIVRLESYVDTVLPFYSESLPKYFVQQNSEMFKYKKGAGYCVWKPFILLQCFERMNYGDILFYSDVADHIETSFISFLRGYMSNDNHFFVRLDYPNSTWTKRDCFIKMGCDTKEYWDAPHFEAGNLALIKTDTNIEFVSEWLKYCQDPEILITEIPSTHGNELLDYRDHRYDQSVLSILGKKYNKLSVSIRHLSSYIEYNKYD